VFSSAAEIHTGLALFRIAHAARATGIAAFGGDGIREGLPRRPAFASTFTLVYACAYGHWLHRTCSIHHSCCATYVSLFSFMSF
jgi:hypothetical protein